MTLKENLKEAIAKQGKKDKSVWAARMFQLASALAPHIGAHLLTFTGADPSVRVHGKNHRVSVEVRPPLPKDIPFDSDTMPWYEWNGTAVEEATQATAHEDVITIVVKGPDGIKIYLTTGTIPPVAMILHLAGYTQ